MLEFCRSNIPENRFPRRSGRVIVQPEAAHLRIRICIEVILPLHKTGVRAGSAHKQYRQLLVIVKISAAHQVVRNVIRHALECFSSLIHSFLIDHGRADIAIDDQNRKYYSPCPGSTYILFYHRLICARPFKQQQTYRHEQIQSFAHLQKPDRLACDQHDGIAHDGQNDQRCHSQKDIFPIFPVKHFSEAVQQSDAQRQKYQNEKAHRLQNVMPIVILKKVSSKQLVGLCNGIGQIFQYRKYRNIRSSIITCHLPSTCPYDQLCEQEIQNHSCSCAAKTSSNVGMDLFSVHIAEQKQ